MEYFSAFYQYVSALLQYWWALIPNGVLVVDSALDAVSTRYRRLSARFLPQDTKRRLIFYLCVGAVFLAGFLAWMDENKKVKNESQRGEQLKGINSQQATTIQEKDKIISDQSKTIGNMEAKLKEQPKVVYRDSPQVSKPTPIRINNLLVEVRAVCNLRDPLKPLNDIGDAHFSKEMSFFEGPTGKAYLRPLTQVRFQRMEEDGRASTTLRYDLPSNSDLLGKPVSALAEYKHMRITLWALDANRFTQCGFLETTLRLNGIDVLRQSITTLPPMTPNLNRWIEIPLKAMKLPE